MTTTELELKVLKHELDVMMLKDELLKLKFEIFKLKNPNSTLVESIKYRKELLKEMENGTD